MKFKIQLFTEYETGEDNQELLCLKRKSEGLEEIGITLAEAKNLLAILQKQMVEQQLAAYLATQQNCPHCTKPFRHKDQHPIVFRTLFGNLKLSSPRWFNCTCQPHQTHTFTPLAKLLTEHCSPERLYLETKWSSLISFNLAAQLMNDVLPTDSYIRATSVRNHLQQVAKRAEAELGEEQLFFINGCQRDWEALLRPPAPINVGIDGGYVRQWDNKKLTLKSLLANPFQKKGLASVLDSYNPMMTNPNDDSLRFLKAKICR